MSHTEHLTEPTDTVTHPSTNRARRRLTSLIETNAIPLRQTTTAHSITTTIIIIIIIIIIYTGVARIFTAMVHL